MILTKRYVPLSFKNEVSPNDLKTLYRLIFSFYDPAVRALCLQHVLEKFGTLTNLPSVKQDVDKGVRFHFMHNALKEKVFRKILMDRRKFRTRRNEPPRAPHRDHEPNKPKPPEAIRFGRGAWI